MDFATGCYSDLCSWLDSRCRRDATTTTTTTTTSTTLRTTTATHLDHRLEDLLPFAQNRFPGRAHRVFAFESGQPRLRRPSRETVGDVRDGEGELQRLPTHKLNRVYARCAHSTSCHSFRTEQAGNERSVSCLVITGAHV